MVEWKGRYEKLLDPEDRPLVVKQAIFFEIRDLGLTAGRYTSPGSFGIHLIQLSPYLHEREARETLGHEYAHFVGFLKTGTCGHGKEWRKLMTILGLPPLPTHQLPLYARKVIQGAADRLKEHGR